MSILTIEPFPETFSKVPHLKEAVMEFDTKEVKRHLNSLGSIFAKHNAYTDFGISLSHRHFDIESDQILVHTLARDKSTGVSIPWNVQKDLVVIPSNPAFLETHNITPTDKYVVPDNWIFDPENEGHLIPFEFRTSDTAVVVEPTVEFSMELYSALKKLGLENVLGVRNISDVTGGSYEITPKGVAANITTYGKMPKSLSDAPKESMIIVGWMYGEDGNLRFHTLECSGHIGCSGCSNTCYYCPGK